LPSQAKFRLDRMRLVKKNQMVMIVVAGLWILAVIVVFGINYWGSFKLASAKKGYSMVNKDFAGLSESIATSQRLKYNAKLLGRVLGARFEYGKAFISINQLFPPGLVLTDLKLEEEKFNVKGQAEMRVMDEVEKLIDKVNRGGNSDFSTIKLVDIKLNNGVWALEMEVSPK
jgi:hypothetical protein